MGVFYLPPNYCDLDLSQLEDAIFSITHTVNDCVLMGDFNVATEAVLSMTRACHRALEHGNSVARIFLHQRDLDSPSTWEPPHILENLQYYPHSQSR